MTTQHKATEIFYSYAHPLLDPQKSGRVLMDPLMKLVTTALKWSYAQREADVTSQHLKAAAELLTLRRDKIQIIDAENNRFKEEQEKQESEEEQEKPKPKGRKAKEQEKPKPKGRKAKEPKKQPSPNEPENPSPK